MCLVFLAHARAQSGNADASTGAAHEALTLFDALDWDWGRGLAHTAVAVACLGRGETFEAQQALEESERLLRSDGSWWYLLVCLNLQIQLALVGSDADLAVTKCHEALDVAQRIGDATALTLCLTSLAGALTLKGRSRRAARLFGTAEALRERTGAAIQPASRSALYEQHLAMLRETLAEDVLEAEWATGRTLTADEAVRDARSDSSP
jgi:hypothetical protein